MRHRDNRPVETGMRPSGARHNVRRGRSVGRRVPTVVAVGLLIWSVSARPDVAGALVILAVPFTLIERLRPLRAAQRPALRRTGAATDAAAFIVDEVVASLALVGLLTLVMPVVGRVMPDAVP